MFERRLEAILLDVSVFRVRVSVSACTVIHKVSTVLAK